MSGRLRRLERPRTIERLVICPRVTHPAPAAPGAPAALPSTARRPSSPAALALLRAYRLKMLALPDTRPAVSPVPVAVVDQHLVPLALLLLLAASAAWCCTWLG